GRPPALDPTATARPLVADPGARFPLGSHRRTGPATARTLKTNAPGKKGEPGDPRDFRQIFYDEHHRPGGGGSLPKICLAAGGVGSAQRARERTQRTERARPFKVVLAGAPRAHGAQGARPSTGPARPALSTPRSACPSRARAGRAPTRGCGATPLPALFRLVPRGHAAQEAHLDLGHLALLVALVAVLPLVVALRGVDVHDRKLGHHQNPLPRPRETPARP